LGPTFTGIARARLSPSIVPIHTSARAAYSVAFPPSHPTDLDVMAKEIIPIKPGEAAGSADKQLTALLLDAKSEHTLISFGAVSRERFADMCDNPRAEP